MQNSLLTAFLCIVLGVNISAAVSGACVDADFSNNTPVGKTFDIKQADIPPLLKFENGLPVSTSSDWVRRRKELRDQLCR